MNLTHIVVRFIFEVSVKSDEINYVILIKYMMNLFTANVLQLNVSIKPRSNKWRSSVKKGVF